MSLEFLERAQPPEVKATSSGRLTKLCAVEGGLQHFVEVSEKKRYRFEAAFYDAKRQVWWARDPEFRNIALITWTGSPPQRIPPRMLRRAHLLGQREKVAT